MARLSRWGTARRSLYTIFQMKGNALKDLADMPFEVTAMSFVCSKASGFAGLMVDRRTCMAAETRYGLSRATPFVQENVGFPPIS